MPVLNIQLVLSFYLFNFYRATLHDNDVWRSMQSNWNHFFWLTGETPETLQILVNILNRRFFWHRQYGRRSSLDLRHQVSMYLDLNWTKTNNLHSLLRICIDAIFVM